MGLFETVIVVIGLGLTLQADAEVHALAYAVEEADVQCAAGGITHVLAIGLDVHGYDAEIAEQGPFGRQWVVATDTEPEAVVFGFVAVSVPFIADVF